jgi:hypothetical protein
MRYEAAIASVGEDDATLAVVEGKFFAKLSRVPSGAQHKGGLLVMCSV